MLSSYRNQLIDLRATLIFNGLTPKVVHKADVSAPLTVKKTYFGLFKTTFKERYRNHVHAFKHRKYETSTGLFEYIWKLQDEGLLPTVKWKLLSNNIIASY